MKAVYLSIAVAVVGWFVTFGVAWGNFWVKIGVSVVVLTAFALYQERPKIRWTWSSVAIGAFSAVVLYGIFYLGNALGPYVVPGAHSQVSGIYDLGTATSRILTFLLLMFVTGPGEEIFWRGFLQKRLMARFGEARGFLIGSAVYAGVHVFSGNIMLIGAAGVAGLFWGGLYLWRRDLTIVIVSHSLWSAFIFAVFPIHNG